MSTKTSDKRPKKPGKNGNPPPDNGRKFTKDYQPSGEAKSHGKLVKKKGQDLAKAILELSFSGAKNAKDILEACQMFGIGKEDITVETMLLFKQAKKAITDADTAAFNAVMDRAHGKPKQQTEIKLPRLGADAAEVLYEE